MKNLPEWMYINGTVYYYNEWKNNDESLKGDWFFCGLFLDKNRNGIPPEVKTRDGYLFLCSSGFSFEEVRNDLLNRINNMVYEVANQKKKN